MNDTTPGNGALRGIGAVDMPDNVVSLYFDGSDEELVAAVKRRDRRAMGELANRYGRYIERLVARLLGFDNALPDIVQEVFVRAIRDMASLRNPNRLKPWLRGIAVNTVRSELRRRTRWSWLTFSDPVKLPETDPGLRSVSECELVDGVQEILATLSVEDRMVLSLRYFEEMEQLDIGRELNISLATVKRRLARATERFLIIAGRNPALARRVPGSAEAPQ